MNLPTIDRQALQPGDLAIVIREHCVIQPLGKIVTIGSTPPPDDCSCMKCFTRVTLPLVNIIEGNVDGFWPIAWLRKLPPITESESEKHEEEVEA